MIIGQLSASKNIKDEYKSKSWSEFCKCLIVFCMFWGTFIKWGYYNV